MKLGKVIIYPFFCFIYTYLSLIYHFCPYLSIFALNFPELIICAIFTLYRYSSIEHVESNRTIIPGDIALGDTKVLS